MYYNVMYGIVTYGHFLFFLFHMWRLFVFRRRRGPIWNSLVCTAFFCFLAAVFSSKVTFR